MPIYYICVTNSIYSYGPLGSRILEYIDTYILFIYTYSIPRIYYGPYINSSTTTRKRYKRVSSSSAGDARTS